MQKVCECIECLKIMFNADMREQGYVNWITNILFHIYLILICAFYWRLSLLRFKQLDLLIYIIRYSEKLETYCCRVEYDFIIIKLFCFLTSVTKFDYHWKKNIPFTGCARRICVLELILSGYRQLVRDWVHGQLKGFKVRSHDCNSEF